MEWNELDCVLCHCRVFYERFSVSFFFHHHLILLVDPYVFRSLSLWLCVYLLFFPQFTTHDHVYTLFYSLLYFICRALFHSLVCCAVHFLSFSIETHLRHVYETHINTIYVHILSASKRAEHWLNPLLFVSFELCDCDLAVIGLSFSLSVVRARALIK